MDYDEEMTIAKIAVKSLFLSRHSRRRKGRREGEEGGGKKRGGEFFFFFFSCVGDVGGNPRDGAFVCLFVCLFVLVCFHSTTFFFFFFFLLFVFCKFCVKSGG